MGRVTARYMNSSEVVLEVCDTVNAIRVKIANLHDAFVPDITVLSIDTSTPLAGSDAAPAHVQVVISKPVDPCNDAHRWQSVLLAHARAQDMAGVHRAMTSIDQDAPEAAKTEIYTKALWYYLRDIFGPCGHDTELHNFEHVDMSLAPHQRGALDLVWVQTLLERRADVNFYNRSRFVGKRGLPLLAFAAQNGHVEACQVLLAAGAEVDGKCGATTHLMLAAGNGHLELCRLLVSAGAYLYSPFEETPLEYVARTSGDAAVCKLLLTLHALQFVRALSSDERQAYLAAASLPPLLDWATPGPSRLVDLSAVLLPTDCALACCDEDDKTLFAHAVREFVNISHSWGSGPDTVLSTAASGGHVDLCGVCIAAGADVNFRNWEGFLPLDFAATDDVRELLISAGAEPGRGYLGVRGVLQDATPSGG
eukprot:GEMP01014694.1.p1 GENE.GEMP01014694.1~~GEMP01014694.1.p1  ORF type:complete len:423 (+),score=113.00 GEMP01014694.1:96-1364(+)